MGFQLAEAFVDVTLRDAKYSAGLVGIHSSLKKMTPAFTMLESMATKFLLTSGGLAAFAIKEFTDAEASIREFAAALEIAGTSYDKVGASEEEFFNSIQRAYVLQNDEVRRLASTALKLGASFNDVNKIVTVGIGLGERYFGGDAKAGVEALTLAQEGNFRAIGRMIPELAHAKTAQEALDILMKKGNEGLKLASAHTNSLSGNLRQMWNEIRGVAQSVGQMFVPEIVSGTEFIRRMAIVVEGLNEGTKILISRTVMVAAALAAVVVIAPRVTSAIRDIYGGLLGLVQFVAKGLGVVLTSKLFLIVAGLAAVATGLAYLAGEGDTAVDRIVSGFGLMGEGLDTFLGSFQGFSAGLEVVWIAITGFLVDVWWAAFEKMSLVWENIRTGAKTTVAIIMGYYEALTDNIANLMAKVAVNQSSENKIRADFAKKKPNATEDEIQEALRKEFKLNNDYIDKQSSYKKDARQKAYNDELVNIDKEYDVRTKYNKDQINTERDNANKLSQSKLDEKLDVFNKSPKLSDKFKELIDRIRKSPGGVEVDRIMKEFKALMDEFNKTKGEADKFPGFENNSLSTKQGGSSSLNFTSLQDAFKQNLALSIVGDAVRQKAADEAKAMRQKQLKEQERTTTAVNELHKAVVDAANETAGMRN